MYKLLIADDEPTERNFVRWIIRSYHLPFTICGEAADGEEAVSLAEAHQPDVVIMDISMPLLGGLEAAAAICSKQPQTLIYMLTAYRYFEYAQEAIRFGARDYLLKPVKPQVLVAALKAGLNLALRRRLAVMRQERLRQLNGERHAKITDHLLIDMAGLRRDNNGFLADWETFPEVRAVFAANVRADKRQGSQQALLQSLAQRLSRQAGIIHAVAVPPDTLLAVAAMTHTEMEQALAKWLQPCQAGLCVQVLPVEPGRGQVAHALQAALKAVQLSQFWEEGAESGDEPQTHPLDAKTCAQTVVNELLVGTAPSGLEACREFLAGLKYNQQTRDQVIHSLEHLIALISHDVSEFVSKEYAAEFGKFYAEKFHTAATITEMQQALADVIKSLALAIRGTGETAAQHSVKKAVNFIQRHCHTNLNLETVAGNLFLSPCYFSRIFKKHTGKGFAQFLNECRMDKAKVLLSAGKYSIAEVAHKTGIQDTSYFCSVFKKHYQLTPSLWLSQQKENAEQEGRIE